MPTKFQFTTLYLPIVTKFPSIRGLHDTKESSFPLNKILHNTSNTHTHTHTHTHIYIYIYDFVLMAVLFGLISSFLYWKSILCINARLKRVCITIVAMECSECVSMCVCKLNYPARKAHAPYRHLSLVRLYKIFPHYVINGKIFGKMSLNIKCLFIFPTNYVRKIFHSKKNPAGYYHKFIWLFM